MNPIEENKLLNLIESAIFSSAISADAYDAAIQNIVNFVDDLVFDARNTEPRIFDY